MHAMNWKHTRKPGKSFGRRTREAVRILMLVAISLLISIAAWAQYTDDFTSAPTFSNGNKKAETGTAVEGLVYETTDCTLSHLGGKLSVLADVVGPGSFTIEARDGSNFIFYELWIDNFVDSATITGTGPEPFTTNVPKETYGDVGPGGAGKLVSRVTVSSPVDLDVFIDNVDVEFGDSTKPDVTIDQAGGQADPANSSPVLFTVVFNEPINEATFTNADVSIGGTATTGTVTITEIAPNDDTTFEVEIVVTADGTVIPTIPAGGVEDLAANTNNASTSTDNAVTVDTDKPDVTIDQAGGQADPTNSSPVAFTVVFDEPINDATLTLADVNVGGTATTGLITVTEIAPNDDTTFEVSIVVTADGTVIPTISAGGVEDPSGNTNNASTSTDNSVTYDGTKPDVTIDQAGAQVDPTSSSPVAFTVVFDEPIDDATFTSVDLSVGGTATTGTVTVIEVAPNDDTTFEVTIVVAADGTVIPTIPSGGVADPVGNTNNASTSTDNTVTYDGTKPDVTINQAGGQADPTNSSPVTFTVVFDEPINDTTFTNADVSVGGTATTGTVTVTEIAPNDDTTFEVEIVVTADGTVIPTIPAGGVEDPVGNTNNASTSTDNSVTYDATDPEDPTPWSSSHTVSVWDDDNTVDIQISGAADTGSGVDGFEIEWDQSATWTPTETKEQEENWTGATLTATSDGDWYFHIATVDNAGNWTSTQHLGPFQIDTTPPSVPTGLDPANGSYTNDTSPTFSWDASTDTGGSGIRDTSAYRIVVTGPVPRDTYVSDTDYNPTLSEGTFTWKVYARDNAGNSSAYTADVTLYIDATQPDVTIDQAGGQADPTNVSPVAFTVVFDEPIDETTFTNADVSVGGTATTGAVTVTEIAPNDDTTFEVSIVVTADGTVIPTIPAGGIEDLAGNTNTASTSTDNSVTVDISKPDVTVDQAGGQADPTNASPVAFTIVFNEPINEATFTNVDVSVGGTATTGAVAVTEIAPNDDTTFEVSIVVTGDGTVVPMIPAGGVEDLYGNTNNASTSTDNSVSYDGTKPDVTINQAGGQADPTGSSPVLFTVVFDEPIDEATFTNADVSVGGTATTGAVTVTEIAPNDDTTFEVSIAVTGTGTVEPTIPAGGIEDVTGNTNNASTSTDNSVTVDLTKPEVTIDQAGGQADPTSSSPVAFTVVFNEPINEATFTNVDVSVGGTATTGAVTVTEIAPNDDTTFEVSIVATGDGTVVPTIPAGGIEDVLGNTNNASNSNDNSVTYDGTPPTVAGITVSDVWIDDLDVGSTFTIIVTYSEDMVIDGSADPVIAFTPVVATTLAVVAGTWTGSDTWEGVYSVLDAGIVELGVDIGVSGAKDLIGNTQIAFDDPDRFDIDTLNPPPGTQWLFVEPMGSAGPEAFLDRCIEVPEGEEPPMAGESELSAVYEVGELVTGSCNVCNANGSIMRGTGVHVWVYSVDLSVRPEVGTLLDHWTVHYDGDCGAYAFEWDTTAYAPGIYDIRLGFEDESFVNIRIQLEEPAE